MLVLKDINKEYPQDKGTLHVLKDINLTFPSSGFITILGPSGCGKTTLLNLIGGLDIYTSGDLIIEGKSTKEYSASDWDSYRNHHIGFVFQSYNLISHLSVFDNVELSLKLSGESKKVRKEKVIKTLKSVGLENEIYKDVKKLSGGQMQRVAIARALINNPNIILADEPTGALDSKTSEQIMSVLKEISKTRLVIMVTHNEEIADEYSDRIIRMLDGRIVEDEQAVVPEEKTKAKFETPKTAMSLSTSLKSSFKNLWTKKGRSILISIAGSLGIIGIAVTSAVSYGFNAYVRSVESGVMSTYPISVMANSFDFEQAIKTPPNQGREEFPGEEIIYIHDTDDPEQTGFEYYFNNITDDYVDYLKKFEEDGIAKSVMVNYMTRSNLITRKPNGKVQPVGRTSYNYFTPVPQGTFGPLLGGENFMNEMYDLIGTNSRYPKTVNEAVIVIDKYNRVSLNTLQNLGILDTGEISIKEISFDDVIGKKYKLIKHDEYFVYHDPDGPDADYNEDIFVKNAFYTGPQAEEYRIKKFQVRWGELENFFVDPDIGIELEIVGVLRPKESLMFGQLSDGIRYLPELANIMKEENVDSEIGKSFSNNFASDLTLEEIMALSEDELAKALTSAIKFYSPFYDSSNPQRQISAQEFLNSAKYYGATFEDIDTSNEGNEIISRLIGQKYTLVESLAIFANTAKDKKEIIHRLDQYNIDHPENEIKYFDAVDTITDSIATLVRVVTIVLLVFTSIALVVSLLLISIITYISVFERTKEIGILRSIGARKLDIMRLFQAENIIIGLSSGIIGVGLAYIIIIPLNYILNNAFPGQGLEHIAQLPIYTALLLILINVLLSMLAGLFPSLKAARQNPVEALRTE